MAANNLKRNAKHEIRNSKQILNFKSKCSKGVLNFGHSIFGFVSDFDIRYSNFITVEDIFRR